MKTQTYIRSSLLTPYILWVIFLGIAMTASRAVDDASASTSFITIMSTITNFYVIGIILWGIPYTILAFGLWLWSRGRDLQKITRVFALSPFFLAILMMLETFIVSFNWSDMANGFSQLSTDFGASFLTFGGLSILYGYLCIGFAIGLYKILKSLNVFNREEKVSTPAVIVPPAI
jgi:hypothetical protein